MFDRLYVHGLYVDELLDAVARAFPPEPRMLHPADARPRIGPAHFLDEAHSPLALGPLEHHAGVVRPHPPSSRAPAGGIGESPSRDASLPPRYPLGAPPGTVLPAGIPPFPTQQ